MWALGIAFALLQLLGAASAVDAVMHARTPQGATAWAVALVLLPVLTLPLYWVFGRSRFAGYVEALRDLNARVEARLVEAHDRLAEWVVPPESAEDERTESELRGFARLARAPFMRGNGLRLLINGKATFDAIFAAIDRAEDYFLAQFYTIHDDDLGRAFQRRLVGAAARGARVHLLYDEVGSYALPDRYVRELEEAGVHVSAFSGDRGWLGRFRLNFRNHRKIVVADGHWAATGGHNVGDEYVGRHERLSPWRDTHLSVEGPAVLGLQLSFIRDWYYSRGEVLEGLRWDLEGSPRNQDALVIASGPSDPLETAGLLYTQAISAAEERVWIASPYFVPDGRVLGTLQTAALRGVDVRVLMPRIADHWMFKFVPYAFLPDVERAGVSVFLYEEGFLHQKVVLVDDDYAAVGTANLDNRSFLLNFEVTVLAHDRDFCSEVEAMLAADFARSTRLTEADLTQKPFPFRLAAQGTRLLAPIL
ncbi:MAG TPA: cardiolipin synthase [Longimicrobiales bacterium]|nr:cardiolipin synthase [Longimicrobiales bacterium]